MLYIVSSTALTHTIIWFKDGRKSVLKIKLYTWNFGGGVHRARILKRRKKMNKRYTRSLTSSFPSNKLLMPMCVCVCLVRATVSAETRTNELRHEFCHRRRFNSIRGRTVTHVPTCPMSKSIPSIRFVCILTQYSLDFLLGQSTCEQHQTT